MKFLLHCAFLTILYSAVAKTNFRQSLSERISKNPELRRQLITQGSSLVANTYFSLNVNNAMGFIEMLMSLSSLKPLGVSLNLKENIQLFYMGLADAPRRTRRRSRVINKNYGLDESVRDFLFTAVPKKSYIDLNDMSLVVKTTEGLLRGVKKKRFGAEYVSFVGIPYGRVLKRFQAPKPPNSWRGIRNADEEKSHCPQKAIHVEQIAGNEDCLYLTVSTPSLKAKNLPTIVWIHGGGFKAGLGNPYFCGPERMMKQNVLMVNVNFRVGALGFLYTGTKEAAGNMGLKDIVAALKWLKNNLKVFGGDPDNITVYGISSGATTIDYLSFSPLAKGLFSKAILSSGCGLNDWGISKDPLKYAFRLGRYLGTNTTYVNDLIKFLRNADVFSIVKAEEKMRVDINPLGDFLIFTPVVEESIKGVEIFLPDYPETIMKSGDYYQVPTMINFNSKEGIYFSNIINDNKDFYVSFDKNIEFFLPYDILPQLQNPQERNDIIGKIKQFYFQGRKINKEILEEILAFLGDTRFLHAVQRCVSMKLEHLKYPIYYSEMAYDGELSPFKLTTDLVSSGVGHADELGYVFMLPFSDIIIGNNATTRLVSDRITKMIANFMRYGNPTPHRTKLLPVTWYPVQSDKTFDYIRITDILEMRTNPNKERYDFWTKLYKYQKQLIASTL